jgi:hypothetical protein
MLFVRERTQRRTASRCAALTLHHASELVPEHSVDHLDFVYRELMEVRCVVSAGYPELTLALCVHEDLNLRTS